MTSKTKHSMRNISRITLAALMAATFSSASYGQGTGDYPSKPVRVVVAFAAGGGADAQTRLFAQVMTDHMKRPFVVENRTGGGGTIGYAFVAKSAPDGYTLLAVSPSYTIAPALHQNLPYDPVNDFAPISMMSKSPYLILVHPSTPMRSIRDLVAFARAKPGALDMGVTTGGSTHLATAYFASAAKIKVNFVPYRGTGQVITDALGGQIPAFVGSVASSVPLIKAGRLRALGVTSVERASILPDLPTVAESGMPGFDVSTWQGWAAPAGTPAAIINRLNEALVQVSKSQTIIKAMTDDGSVSIGSNPETLRKLIADEVPRWRRIVSELGVKAE